MRYASQRQVTAERAREPAADRETEPDALGRRATSPLDLHERVEHGRLLLIGNSDAGVVDVDEDAPIVARTDDSDRAARRRELHRIREKVQQDLPHLVGVGERNEIALRTLDSDRERLSRGLGLHQLDDLTRRLRELHARYLELDLAALEPSKVQEFVDEPKEVLLAPQNATQVLP